MPVSLSSREVVAILREAGWIEIGQEGSHRQFKHSAKPGRVTVPHPRKDIPAGTLKSIFRQAGLDWPPRRNR